MARLSGVTDGQFEVNVLGRNAGLEKKERENFSKEK